MLDFVKNMYALKRITNAEVMAFVEKGYITEADAKQIIE